MPQRVFYNFTDECGAYKADRSDAFLRSHPFYVRANLIIDMDEYHDLELMINNIKNAYSLSYNIEVKWAHMGSKLKHTREVLPHSLSVDQIKSYIQEVLQCVCEHTHATLYFTFTDNNSVNRISDINLIKMHLQNAFQRSQSVAQNNDGYAIIVADDMNAQNKLLKQALYQLTTEGDQYTDYPNVHKGLFIDFSDNSCGLQIADFLAGVFTASLKYISSPEQEKHKYEFAYSILTNLLYRYIRYNEYHLPYREVYSYGIKEIPSGTGREHAQIISRVLEDKLYIEIMEM